MKVIVHPHEVENLAKGIGHEVGLFLRNRDLMDEEDTFKIAGKIAATIESEIYAALEIAEKP